MKRITIGDNNGRYFAFASTTGDYEVSEDDWREYQEHIKTDKIWSDYWRGLVTKEGRS